MIKKKINRRKFISTLSAGTAAGAISPGILPPFYINSGSNTLAAMGGTPVVPSAKIGVDWPYIDENVVNSVVETTKSGIWSRIQSRNGKVPTFEGVFAEMMNAGYCVATGSGTQALSTAVFALGIGPGDEVITSPYSDFGTISSILTCRALPVLADLDPESFQLDPKKVEKKINANTKAIMPVHISGLPANMEEIMELAEKYNLKVIEDACQAPFSRYQGQEIGLIGDLGCISFQASKAIACGEGGAVIGNDKELMEECYTIQNRGSSRQGKNETIGPKYRMNEFEGAVLMGQIKGAKERFYTRDKNATFLNDQFKDLPGAKPQKQYDGTESGSYYRYALSYNQEAFNGADRSKFLKAVVAEGIPLSSYIRNGFHREPWVDHVLGLKEYQTMYSSERLMEFKESMDMPNCDKVTDETHVSLWGSGILLGSQEEMQMIVDGVMKVYENRHQLKDL
ncbi:DegT/DnrJ/EryC1/StrS family aminotransferase [Membranihabitans maritimus]|uniref:DegT/DnrJ/EryC1/StrS family aminotransferase n=1 Tax=Membranihabitans maritimus TaxID=2904244 RepID=UPI001F3A579A|nr:DegT/DnrJ/EryC1/StrS family aminotransferase [Membranihabitans maritimus]